MLNKIYNKKINNQNTYLEYITTNFTEEEKYSFEYLIKTFPEQMLDVVGQQDVNHSIIKLLLILAKFVGSSRDLIFNLIDIKDITALYNKVLAHFTATTEAPYTKNEPKIVGTGYSETLKSSVHNYFNIAYSSGTVRIKDMENTIKDWLSDEYARIIVEDIDENDEIVDYIEVGNSVYFIFSSGQYRQLTSLQTAIIRKTHTQLTILEDDIQNQDNFDSIPNSKLLYLTALDLGYKPTDIKRSITHHLKEVLTNKAVIEKIATVKQQRGSIAAIEELIKNITVVHNLSSNTNYTIEEDAYIINIEIDAPSYLFAKGTLFHQTLMEIKPAGVRIAFPLTDEKIFYNNGEPVATRETQPGIVIVKPIARPLNNQQRLEPGINVEVDGEEVVITYANHNPQDVKLTSYITEDYYPYNSGVESTIKEEIAKEASITNQTIIEAPIYGWKQYEYRYPYRHTLARDLNISAKFTNTSGQLESPTNKYTKKLNGLSTPHPTDTLQLIIPSISKPKDNYNTYTSIAFTIYNPNDVAIDIALDIREKSRGNLVDTYTIENIPPYSYKHVSYRNLQVSQQTYNSNTEHYIRCIPTIRGNYPNKTKMNTVIFNFMPPADTTTRPLQLEDAKGIYTTKNGNQFTKSVSFKLYNPNTYGIITPRLSFSDGTQTVEKSLNYLSPKGTHTISDITDVWPDLPPYKDISIKVTNSPTDLTSVLYTSTTKEYTIGSAKTRLNSVLDTTMLTQAPLVTNMELVTQPRQPYEYVLMKVIHYNTSPGNLYMYSHNSKEEVLIQSSLTPGQLVNILVPVYPNPHANSNFFKGQTYDIFLRRVTTPQTAERTAIKNITLPFR